MELSNLLRAQVEQNGRRPFSSWGGALFLFCSKTSELPVLGTPGLTFLTLSSPTESYTVDTLIPRLLNLTELYTIDFPGSLAYRGHIMGLPQTPEPSKPIPTINLLLHTYIYIYLSISTIGSAVKYSNRNIKRKAKLNGLKLKNEATMRFLWNTTCSFLGDNVFEYCFHILFFF